MNATPETTETATFTPPTGFFDGEFTVSSPKGSHRTFRVKTMAQDSKFAPGEQTIALLIGADNENSYRSFAFLKEGGMRVYRKQQGTETAKAGLVLVSLLRGDELGKKLTEAGYTVLESRRCFRCQRLLTDPISISVGMGPECRTKG